YTNRTLNVAIPYEAPRAGTGQLVIDVLNPEDAILAHLQRTVDVTAGKGRWEESLKLAKTPSVGELGSDRVRHPFTYADRADAAVEGIESISQILHRPVLHIVAQQAYQAGAQAAVRMVVTDATNAAVNGGWARVELSDPAASRVLYTGALNRRGTAEAQFRLPPGLTGTHSLHYVVDTPIGTTDYTQQVRIEEKASILLTTEKPIYQPGQTIHVRALALDRGTHEAASGRDLTFEVEDSRGNKVFKKATQTDKFGIASTEFTLADEVNLGTYHLRALMGTTAEIALNVERYVLPKFKVAVEFAGHDGKARHGYRPGDHVTGTVRAN